MVIRAAWAAFALLAVVATAAAEDQAPKTTTTTDGNFVNITVAGLGTFAEVMRSVKALAVISEANAPKLIDELKRNKNENAPPYLYELARRLAASDKAEAAYYTTLADMRTRYDIMRCTDKSAGAGYNMTFIELRAQVEPLMKVLADKALVADAYAKIEERDEMFTSKVSPWWICSHGMRAALAATSNRTLKTEEWLRPESEWSDAQKKWRDFVASRRTALAKEQKEKGAAP